MCPLWDTPVCALAAASPRASSFLFVRLLRLAAGIVPGALAAALVQFGDPLAWVSLAPPSRGAAAPASARAAAGAQRAALTKQGAPAPGASRQRPLYSRGSHSRARGSRANGSFFMHALSAALS